MQFEPLGESMLLVRFGSRIDDALNAQVHLAAALLHDAQLPGVIDLVPSYAALAIAYDPLVCPAGTDVADQRPPWQQMAARIERILVDIGNKTVPSASYIEIAVCYGGAHGIDLDAVAAHAGMTTDEVIARHTSASYRVAMLGFAPGFAYLLSLDDALHMPRRANPRLRVPAGSVAIGGAQTGIYPRELPGGWHLIGRTPRVLFDPARERPALFAPGDQVRFVAVDSDQFDALCVPADRTR